MATTKVSTKLLETVGVAEGGTGATSTSAARTSLGLVIGTNVLAPNGSAASLTNLPAGGASAAEAANIMVNSFNIAAAGGFAFQNMVDGVVDEFEDETGIDTSTSTNETYDATNDLYENAGDYSADQIPTMTGATAPSGTVTGNPNPSGFELWRLFDKVAAPGGGSGQGAWRSYDGGTVMPAWAAYEFTSAKIITKYTVIIPSATNVNDSPTDWTFDGWDGSGWVNLHTVSGEVAWSNAETRAFYPTTTGSYIKYRMYITDTVVTGYAYQDGLEMMVTNPTTNMTLFSNATTALAAPDDANIVIWQQDVDSVTLNTDLKAYASRNGGTTYTQMTLAEVANLTTGRILTGTVDISGQSSATAMKYKIETLNTKSQKIHAVALQWS